MTPSLNLSNLSKQIKKVIEDLNIQVFSPWAPSCTNILVLPTSRKSAKIGLLVLPVCIQLPIGEAGSFSSIYWCNWLCYHQYIDGTVSAAPIFTWKHMLKNLKKYQYFEQATCCHVSSTNNGPWCNVYIVWCVKYWHIFLQLQ